jgi:hypothetical protein
MKGIKINYNLKYLKLAQVSNVRHPIFVLIKYRYLIMYVDKFETELLTKKVGETFLQASKL